MANAKENVVIRKCRGKLGNVIIRRLGDKTIISIEPDYSKIVWSKKQKENRRKFSKAMKQARKELEDPEKYCYYQSIASGNQTVWNAALSQILTRQRIVIQKNPRRKGTGAYQLEM